MDNRVEIDERIYDELDNFCSEVLNVGGLMKYVKVSREYFQDPEKTVDKLFTEEDIKKQIKTYGDFYYFYLAKYSNCYWYNFNEKGYTQAFKKLVKDNGINPEDLDINWDNVEKKEYKYQEGLIDILYAMIHYELNKRGLTVFGLNMGFKSLLYYITPIEVYERLIANQQLLRMFDLNFLETIYGEIYEVTGNLGVPNLEIGDFIEKKGKIYNTIFQNNDENIELKNIDENDENQVRIIL